jgi:hypothetical protein
MSDPHVGHCKNCQHWDKWDTLDKRECGRLDKYKDMFDCLDGDPLFYADFGCIFFKEFKK